MKCKIWLTFVLVVLGVVLFTGYKFVWQDGVASTVPVLTEPDNVFKAHVVETYGKLPLSFIQNDGQMDEKVEFYQRGNGHSTYFAKDGVYLQLLYSGPSDSINNEEDNNDITVTTHSPQTSTNTNLKSETIKLISLNSNNNPMIVSEGLQEGKVNFFRGNDPEKWKINITTYQAVVYKDIYDGIDMKYYGNNRQMEYDLIVKPGANPSTPLFSYEGIEGLRVTGNGELEIDLKQGTLIQKKPVIYQMINGKRIEIEGKFKLEPVGHDREEKLAYGFKVASYNRDHALIIDPVLAYSTYLGGSGGDQAYGIAVDTSGNAYVTGSTGSTDFPTASPIQGTYAGGGDIFVTKIDSSGTSLVYSTYLGGSRSDSSRSIAVDTSGNAYVTGSTISPDFPTASPIQGTYAGDRDVFVTKIDSSGTNLVYSTYLGGSGGDHPYGIAVDTSGNAYVTGHTVSTDFPTASPIQGTNAGRDDVFVTKIDSSGTSLVYSTYLGGWTYDSSGGIAVDTSGNAYVTGATDSPYFPTASPIQGTNAGGGDGFVTKLSSGGTSCPLNLILNHDSSGQALLRRYRDESLSKTNVGKLLTMLFYIVSAKAVETLNDNPELIKEAEHLIDANKYAVTEVLGGREGIVYNTDEIASFLSDYAKESPPLLKAILNVIRKFMLKKKESGKLFFSFRLE
ncbi:hypothetical protein SCALIN_C01_0247 [Candidatus Scalindua japonica]|uniref:DUF7948 domain-containing protein n=1 Tax=Candidatus Scalindua japonica TaxID=1284222 RepID=A0A286TTW1_9BACT|nr:SBBP repeat-containing protein [Candidatus Scalindua japonica]GAX59316.1 hypothetical protein SCALIN_C01_0247 [Candidatus Scalindua japonica]